MKRRLLWVLVPTVVAAGLTAAWSSHFMPTRYQAETLILIVPQRVPEAYVRSAVASRIEDRLQSIQQQILSRTRLERVINDLNLYPEERKTSIMEDLVEQMRRDIGVQVMRGDAFKVSFTSDDPRTAMKVTERLTSLFIDENLRDRETLAEGTSQFLDAQIDDLRAKIVEKEARLRQLRATTAGELSQSELISYEVLKESYKGLLQKELEARMAANLERRQIGETFKVLDPARLPEVPVGPSKATVNAGGALVGFSLGLVMMVVSSRRKKKQQQPADIEAAV